MTDRQTTLGGGDREVNEDGDGIRRDDGEALGENETCMGFNRFDVSSLLQKSVRRSEREKAIWAAYELCRSGYGWNFWERADILLVEDVRIPPGEAELISAVGRLSQLAEEWGRSSRKGVAAAMRTASLLAEAESSREIFTVQDYWNGCLDHVEELDELNYGDFPIDEGMEDVELQVLDQHTGEGSRKGRGHRHFMSVASRTSETSEMGRKFKRRMMESEDCEYTEEEMENGLSDVEGNPWTEDL
ncbi:MAG: hypothetical protein ABEK59_03540 [Halobacteria archaeon]